MQGPSHCPLHHVPGRAFHVSIWLWGNADTGAQTTKPFFWLQENPFGFHNVNNDTGKEKKGILLCFIYKVILTWRKNAFTWYEILRYLIHILRKYLCFKQLTKYALFGNQKTTMWKKSSAQLFLADCSLFSVDWRGQIISLTSSFSSQARWIFRRYWLQACK